MGQYSSTVFRFLWHVIWSFAMNETRGDDKESLNRSSENDNAFVPVTILTIPLTKLADTIIDPDVATLELVQFPAPSQLQNQSEALSEYKIPPYAAISYPWRDLQLRDGVDDAAFSVAHALHADPISVDVLRIACLAARASGCTHLWLDRLCILQGNKQDKMWQIQRMYHMYKHCTTCLVFPGGLVRLAELDDSTTWIDRAWTLQEAIAPQAKRYDTSTHLADSERVQVVIHMSQPSYPEYIRHRCGVEGYDEAFRAQICSQADTISSYNGEPWPFVNKVLDASRTDQTITCTLERLVSELFGILSSIKFHAPGIADDHERYPIRIMRTPESQILQKAAAFRGYRLWVAAYTRSSSRPIDMVFSVMDLFGVSLDVSQYNQDDRMKAIIALIKGLMRPGRTANRLFIAPTMDPSKELSTLPEMPETSESGRAYITTKKGRVLAFEAIGGGGMNSWRTEGAPKGELTDSGYFVFEAKAALVLRPSAGEIGSRIQSMKTHDNRETWGIIVGRFKNHNRNPETFRIQAYNPDVVPGGWGGAFELTMMFVEKHGHELYHRVGMERELDERKTIGRKWTYRSFSVGGPGRGERKRFGMSPFGPVYSDVDDEEYDELMLNVD